MITAFIITIFATLLISVIISVITFKLYKKKGKEQAKKHREEEKRALSMEEMGVDEAEKIYREMSAVEKQFPEIQALTAKYYPAVCNYIEMRYANCCLFFEDGIFRTNEFYLLNYDDSENVVTPYIERDRYPNGKCNPENEKLTAGIIRILLRKVSDEDEWKDSRTLKTCVYFILRNGIIRYFSEEYDKKYSLENLQDVCREEMEAGRLSYHREELQCLYTCRSIYKGNILQPLGDEYRNVGKQIYSFLSETEEEKLENNLFRSPDVRGYGSETGREGNEDDPFGFSKGWKEDPTTVLERIDKMDGREFEEFIAEFFRKQGYKVTLTPLSGDYGVDVIIENDLMKIGIQTKRYSEKVGNEAVQEAVTAIRHYHLDKAMVITNSTFQPSAIRLAEDNNVILWDRDKLFKKLEEAA